MVVLVVVEVVVVVVARVRGSRNRSSNSSIGIKGSSRNSCSSLRQESLRNSKAREHSSLQSLFEIDWDDLGAELLEKASRMNRSLLQDMRFRGIAVRVDKGALKLAYM